MKRIATIAILSALIFVASGCGEKNKPSDKLLDKDAMVYINVENGKATRAINPDLPDNPKHLSPKDLVAQAEAMIQDMGKAKGARFWLGGIIDEHHALFKDGSRKLGEYQYKDVENAKFILWGDFIINMRDPENPKLVEDFFTCKNVHFVDKEGNIIGYIPQRVFREGWEKIKTAFEAKDYDKVYKLFEEVYTAYPCTPEEYAKLKEEGKN